MSEKMWNNNGKNGDHFKNKTSCQKSILRQNLPFRYYTDKGN